MVVVVWHRFVHSVASCFPDFSIVDLASWKKGGYGNILILDYDFVHGKVLKKII